MFIDNGFGGNQPSTVVDLCVSPPKIIRQGAGGVFIEQKKRNL
jgi:tRNA A37 threonylcarbamoyladenosine synthetase subunit TsaC/SUA5/YrdC